MTAWQLEITSDHERRASKRSNVYGGKKSYWMELVLSQRGLCALSEAPMRFDASAGSPRKRGPGCHPLFASGDHCWPGCDDLGHQIVCYDLNDLKGHLPPDCFAALQATRPWKALMRRWLAQARLDPNDIGAFKAIVSGRGR